MSFLTAAQSAAIRLIGRKPTTFFSSQNTFELEIADLANEVAADLVKYADWRTLIAQHSMVGDGVTTAFNLPSDYDRMPFAQHITRANWYTWGYVDAPDLNYWNDLVNGLATPNPGYWIILGGQVQFRPAVSAGETAQFYYVSKNIVLDADATTKKAQFTQDDDSLRVDERLLTLGLIWRWRAQKRLEYSEDLQNYEIAAAQASSNDRGARILTEGRPRTGWATTWAYPRSLGT
ncbi:hypothetical protein NL154_05685 [Rhizobium sp. YTUHZ044]|uniref:hypothetical protein n=1 Tax=Rhizobium sp. YTUHZ044 TaxID=2962678 RepID=UPI003DA95883